MKRTENGEQRTENRERRTENGKQKTESRKQKAENRKPISVLRSRLSALSFPLSAFRSQLSVFCSLFSVLCFLFSLSSCTKTLSTSKPVALQSYKQTYSANPNQIYYALRWALKAYGYPIAEEDLQNGVLKTRVVPVKATSHYIDVFGHKDFGVSGAYHKMEIKLTPKGGQTEVRIASHIQATVKQIKSTGQEEEMILKKVGDYLRSASAKVTNQGVEE